MDAVQLPGEVLWIFEDGGELFEESVTALLANGRWYCDELDIIRLANANVRSGKSVSTHTEYQICITTTQQFSPFHISPLIIQTSVMAKWDMFKETQRGQDIADPKLVSIDIQP